MRYHNYNITFVQRYLNTLTSASPHFHSGTHIRTIIISCICCLEHHRPVLSAYRQERMSSDVFRAPCCDRLEHEVGAGSWMQCVDSVSPWSTVKHNSRPKDSVMVVVVNSNYQRLFPLFQGVMQESGVWLI